jgi:hypothetical protein
MHMSTDNSEKAQLNSVCLQTRVKLELRSHATTWTSKTSGVENGYQTGQLIFKVTKSKVILRSITTTSSKETFNST